MDVLLNSTLSSVQYDNNTYKLKEFLTNSDNDKYQLPIIVNIVSLNNYGRSIKNILIKNTPLLLLEFDQLESVIADYYSSQDERSHSHRGRLMLSQNKMVSRSTAKIRNMKKLSQSVASLSVANQKTNPDDDDYLDDDDENAYNLRAFIKLLNEKRSPSVSLCRIPTQYRSFFELLNADGQPIDPYYKLSDLPKMECDDHDSEKRPEKTPLAVFLRSSCNAYTKKHTPENLRLTTNDQNSNLTVSVDSCYGSSSDLDSHKNSIVLNDNPEILQAGQTLVILDDCYAVRTQILDKEIKQPKSIFPSSPHFSPANWMRAKSKMFSPRRHRQSNTTENISNETIPSKSTLETFEHYVRCRTQQGDIVYISLDEPCLFSPLNRVIYDSKLKTRSNYLDTSDVFQIKDLLSHFRFPITVRLLDGPISFDNIYAPAVIDRHDTSRLTPTKFRLLGSHNERVVYVCPLNKVSLKAAKTSLPYVVLPLSINADIEIQPCMNMHSISKTDAFRQMIIACSQIIRQHQTEITLVHFPLSLTMNTNEDKQILYKKRSQSESYNECIEDDFNHQFRHSAEQLNERRRHSDESSFLTACSLRNRENYEPVKQSSSIDTVREEPSKNRSGYRVKDKKDRYSRDTEATLEDEIYEDVDKIYDYIRTGYPTEDVKKIQAKDRPSPSSAHIPISTTKVSLCVK